MINLCREYGPKIFRPYLSNCWCCFTLQAGVMSYCVIGTTVVLISLLANSSLGPLLDRNLMPFIILCVYCAATVVGFVILALTTFWLNHKLMFIGACITSAAAIFWFLLAILSLIPNQFGPLVCIENKCPESHWLIDMRWRYNKNQCPFRKGNLENYPLFRKEFFIDEPRDKAWVPGQPQPEGELNRFLKKTDLIILKDNITSNLANISNYIAYYPGCESDDPALTTYSLVLLLAYLGFILHLIWMAFSLINEVKDKDTFDE